MNIYLRLNQQHLYYNYTYHMYGTLDRLLANDGNTNQESTLTTNELERMVEFWQQLTSYK